MRLNDSRPFFWSASMMLLSTASRRGACETGPRRPCEIARFGADCPRNARRVVSLRHALRQPRADAHRLTRADSGFASAACWRTHTGSPGSVEFCHYVLDLGVVLQRVHREVLAVAGLLVAAVR